MPEALYKGSPIAFVRQSVQKKGPDAEQRVLSELTAEEADVFQKSMPISWIPIAPASRVLEVSAPILFPGDVDRALERLGFEMAGDHLKGLYRVVIRVATVPYVVKQAATIWKTYHTKGLAAAEQKKGEKLVELTVTDYPELTRPIRVLANGYYIKIAELTGAKNVKVTMQEQDPNRWLWTICWE